MLANGTKLGYSATGTTPITYIDLVGSKEIPAFESNPEEVENTPLSASNKTYEKGIGDYGDLEYTFKWDNSSATSPYRVMQGYDASGATVFFKHEYKDGTAATFSAQVSVSITGGALNAVIDAKVKLTLNSSIVWTNPTT